MKGDGWLDGLDRWMDTFKAHKCYAKVKNYINMNNKNNKVN